MKKIILCLMILLSVKSFGQTERAKESQELIDAFIGQGDFVIQKKQFADTIENLNFEGYEKFTAEQLENVRIQYPRYILIDTSIQKPKKRKNKVEKDTKKKGGFSKLVKGFLTETFELEQNSSATKKNNQMTNKKMKNIVYSELKLLWGDYYSFNGKGINDFTVSKEIRRVDLKVKDFVLKKFKGESTGNFVYATKLTVNGHSLIGFIQEKDLNKKNDLKIKDLNSLMAQKKSQDLSKMKNDSENWLDTNFREVFPEGKLYFYKVKYGMCNGRNNDTIAIEAWSYSNISPNIIEKSNFPAKKHHILTSFEFQKEIDLFDAIYEDEILIDSIYYSKGISTSAYRWWNKDESVHFLLDAAKNDIIKTLPTKNIYGEKYFTELVNKEWQTFYDTEMVNDFQLIQTLPMTLSIGINEHLKKVNEIQFEISKNGRPSRERKLKIRKNEQNLTFEFDGIERDFDLRVDKTNFKFVEIIPSFLGAKHQVYTYFETPNYQPSPEFLKEELVQYCVNDIQGFIEYKNADILEAKKDAQLKNNLKKKYGAKYVEAAYEGRIIVGMHEDLLAALMKYWEITNKSSWKGGYKIYCKSKLDYSTKITVHVKNKKVTYVSNY